MGSFFNQFQALILFCIKCETFIFSSHIQPSNHWK